MDLVFALIALITSTCLGVLVFTGLLGRIPIADVSARGEKIVVTTSVAHFLLERACPAVALTGTEIPDLERSNNFTVKALSMYQLTLQSEQSDNNKPLDTSMGHLHLKFPHAFCSAGLWRCPLIWWCLLFLAATVGAVSQLNWCLELLACGLGLCTGALAFAWRFRLGGGGVAKLHLCNQQANAKIYRRKFRSQTSNNMDRWKRRGGKSQTREEKRREEKKIRRSKKRKSEKKEDAGARKGRKVAIHSVFPMICGSGGSKSRLAKAAGAESGGQIIDEKLHAVVARSTFASEKAIYTSRSEHFWKLRC